MPYITFDPETGCGLMHVDLASMLAGKQFMRDLDAIRDSSRLIAKQLLPAEVVK